MLKILRGGRQTSESIGAVQDREFQQNADEIELRKSIESHPTVPVGNDCMVYPVAQSEDEEQLAIGRKNGCRAHRE